ncbi:MAG: putative manganese transporter [Clostridia bacterium]|nr:putative manganese transporter [Clostridia bacterium]
MELFLDILLESLIDAAKMLPFLLVMFFLIEFFEHRAGNKALALLTRASKCAPVAGALLGVVPQCGFSVLASGLYAKRLITMGTLLAVFLSTSDEAIILLIYHRELLGEVLIMALIKVAVGIAFGYLCDAVFRSQAADGAAIQQAHTDKCHEHCGCSCNSIGAMVKTVILHSLKVFAYIFVASLILSSIVAWIGEDVLSEFMMKGTFVQPLLATLVGLIPNCAASVIIAEAYIDGMLSFGSLLAGLCAAAGVGILVLFQENKSVKNSILVLVILVVVSAVVGIAADAVAMLL